MAKQPRDSSGRFAGSGGKTPYRYRQQLEKIRAQEEQLRATEKQSLSKIKKGSSGYESLKNYYRTRKIPLNAQKELVGRKAALVSQAKSDLGIDYAKSYSGFRRISRGALSLVGALGVPISKRAMSSPGGQKTGMRGRPPGSGKYQQQYGVGVYEYRKMQAQRRAVAQGMAQEEQLKLLRRGYTPEQIEQIKLRKRMTEQLKPEQTYEEFVQENTVSPNTMRILEQIKAIQGKAKADDLNQQRIHRERAMVAKQMSLLATPSLFKKNATSMNPLEDDGHNPAMAPYVFHDNPEDNIMVTKRVSLLNTKDSGNDLKFF